MTVRAPASLWRTLGYTVAFRDGLVFRYRPDRGVSFQPVDGGAWEARTNGWSPAPDEEDRLMTIRLACYCGQLGTGSCDFCSGLRQPPAPSAL